MVKSPNAQRSTVGNQVRNMAARLATLEAIVKRHSDLFEDFAAAVEQLGANQARLVASHVHPDDEPEP